MKQRAYNIRLNNNNLFTDRYEDKQRQLVCLSMQTKGEEHVWTMRQLEDIGRILMELKAERDALIDF